MWFAESFWRSLVFAAECSWLQLSVSLSINAAAATAAAVTAAEAKLKQPLSAAFKLRGLEFVSCSLESSSAAAPVAGDAAAADTATATAAAAARCVGAQLEPAAAKQQVEVELQLRGSALIINAVGFAAAAEFVRLIGGEGFTCRNPVQWFCCCSSSSSSNSSSSSSRSWGFNEDRWKRLPKAAEEQLNEICCSLTAAALPLAAMPAPLAAAAAATAAEAAFTVGDTRYVVQTANIKRMLEGRGEPWIEAQPAVHSSSSSSSSSSSIRVSRISLLPTAISLSKRNIEEGPIGFL